jgi:hypothetical protein
MVDPSEGLNSGWASGFETEAKSHLRVTTQRWPSLAKVYHVYDAMGSEGEKSKLSHIFLTLLDPFWRFRVLRQYRWPPMRFPGPVKDGTKPVASAWQLSLSITYIN